MSSAETGSSDRLHGLWVGQLFSVILHVFVASIALQADTRRYWYIGLGVSAAWATFNGIGLAAGRRTAAGLAVLRSGAAICVGVSCAARTMATDRSIGDGMGGALFLMMLFVASLWMAPVTLEALVMRGILHGLRASPLDGNLWSPGGERDPREAGRPQIAGLPCVHCSKKILVVFEGQSCDTCQQPVHKDCIGGHDALAHRDTASAYR